MSFPNVVKSIYTMKNSDINVVGEYLGYEWNKVCDEISKAGFYAEDGEGAFEIRRNHKNQYSNESQIINKIFVEIFNQNPKVHNITIINE